ncbi:hypothetical protein BC628DRAFT_1393794 [Trametes gibbosa]|nr:hypothetical protein BC628DRAFT_1393794 [Trametes gibbosa]
MREPPGQYGTQAEQTSHQSRRAPCLLQGEDVKKQGHSCDREANDENAFDSSSACSHLQADYRSNGAFTFRGRVRPKRVKFQDPTREKPHLGMLVDKSVHATRYSTLSENIACVRSFSGRLSAQLSEGVRARSDGLANTPCARRITRYCIKQRMPFTLASSST